MTRAEFIERWKCHVAGGFVYGYADDQRLSPTDRARRVFNIAPEVEQLLGQMYDSLFPTPLANGLLKPPPAQLPGVPPKLKLPGGK